MAVELSPYLDPVPEQYSLRVGTLKEMKSDSRREKGEEKPVYGHFRQGSLCSALGRERLSVWRSRARASELGRGLVAHAP